MSCIRRCTRERKRKAEDRRKREEIERRVREAAALVGGRKVAGSN